MMKEPGSPFEVILGGASLAPVEQGDIRNIRYETFQRLIQEVRLRKVQGHPVYMVEDPVSALLGVVDVRTREYLCIGQRDLLESFIHDEHEYDSPLYDDEDELTPEQAHELIKTKQGRIKLFEADHDDAFDGDPLGQWEEDTAEEVGGDLSSLWDVPEDEVVEDIPIDKPEVDVDALVRRLGSEKVLRY